MHDNRVKVQRTATKKQGLRDLLNLEQRLIQKILDFIQSSKFPAFLSEFQKISERFHALTPEQKRQYFISVEE